MTVDTITNFCLYPRNWQLRVKCDKRRHMTSYLRMWRSSLRATQGSTSNCGLYSRFSLSRRKHPKLMVCGLCEGRYFVRVTVSRRIQDAVKEKDIWVHSYRMPPDSNNSIKMEVGIEDCLHIEFEYNKSRKLCSV